MLYFWFIPVALIAIVLMVLFYKSTTKRRATPSDRASVVREQRD